MKVRNISDDTMTSIDHLDTLLASKIKEIIEGQWGRHLEDVKDLSVGQFHERLVQAGRVSYKPVNRFILQAMFRTTREPRRLIFSLTA
jgi:hypothetical protein